MGVVAENQIPEVNKVIFRYIGKYSQLIKVELRNLYNLYCPKDGDVTKIMTRYEVWRILKDCYITKTETSLGIFSSD